MKKLLVLSACLVLQACAVRTLPPASDLRAGDGEVVVIGKIELVPPIEAKFEQRTHWNVVGEKRLLSHVWVATGSEFRPVKTSTPDTADFQDSLEVEWGVPFMVKAPRQPRTYINGGMAHLNVVQQERLWFPGGLYFDVPSGANAVYIGTLRYHRNDFNAITRVEVIDERRDIATVLKGSGNAADVRPALLKRLR